MISYKRITELSRGLRRKQTQAEELLWQNIRNRKFRGLKFLRQYPIVYEQTVDHRHFFIADFYCHEQKLVIELDGKIHEKQKAYDTERDFTLTSLGLRTLRIKNEEVKSWRSIISEFLGEE